MTRKRSYQRAYLRAPYLEPVLFGDDGYVHKARAVNISEGGILLDEIPEFPREEVVPMVLRLPSFPYFKNYNLAKLQTFSLDLFTAKIIRMKARMVRRVGETTDVDDVFQPRFGLQFQQPQPKEQKLIADYVAVFASNLIYLQMLIDSWNTEEEIRHKARALAEILGYQEHERIAELRHRIVRDYQSLQWL